MTHRFRYLVSVLALVFAMTVLCAMPMLACAEDNAADGKAPASTEVDESGNGAGEVNAGSAGNAGDKDEEGSGEGADGNGSENGSDEVVDGNAGEGGVEQGGYAEAGNTAAETVSQGAASETQGSDSADEPGDAGQNAAQVAEDPAPVQPVVETAAAAEEPAPSAAPATPVAAAQAKEATAPAKTTAKTVETTAAATATPAATQPAKANPKKAAKKAAKKADDGDGPIADGTYVINPLKMNTLMLGSTKVKSKSKVTFQADNNKKNQRWVFKFVEKYGAYTIMNAASKLYLTTTSKKAGKELVWQLSKKGKSNMQMWKLSKSGKAWRILSAANAKLGLGTWSGQLKDGFYGTLQSNKANKLQFYLVPAGNDAQKRPDNAIDNVNTKLTYKVKLNAKKSLAAQVAKGSQDSNASIVLRKNSKSGAQKWRFVRVGDGLYQIVDVFTNKALAMKNGKRGMGTDVVQTTRNKKAQAQQWWISKDESGAYTFTNRLNGLSMISANPKAKSGSNLLSGFSSSAKASKFQVKATKLLDEGIYSIASRNSNTRSLQAPADVTAGKSKIALDKNSSNLDQKYELVEQSDGSFTIRSISSGKYLTANTSGQAVLDNAQGSDVQHWVPAWTGSAIMLVNAGTGKKLALNRSYQAIADTAGTKKSQNFVFKTRDIIDDGAYFMQCVTGKNVIDIEGGSYESRANAQMAKNADEQSQKFTFKRIGKGVYKILNANSKMALTAADDSNGANVNQKKYSGDNSQKWIVKISDNGGVLFVNKWSGKALGVKGKNKDGANVYTINENQFGKSQRWLVESTYAYNDYQMRGFKRATRIDSSSNKYVTVDKSKFRVLVWERDSKADKWRLKFDWPCIVGKSSTPTPEGNFKFTGGYYTNADPRHDCFSAYYYRHIHSGTYFHTLLKRPFSGPNGPTIHGNKFATAVSGGCCRLETKNAKWMYSKKNIPRGTGLSVYS